MKVLILTILFTQVFIKLPAQVGNLYAFSKTDTNYIREVPFDFSIISYANTNRILDLFLSRVKGLIFINKFGNLGKEEMQKQNKDSFFTNYQQCSNTGKCLLADLTDLIDTNNLKMKERFCIYKTEYFFGNLYFKKKHIYYLSLENSIEVSSFMIIGDSSIFFIDELVFWKQDNVDYRKWVFDTTYSNLISKEALLISLKKADERKLLALQKWMRLSDYSYSIEDYKKVVKFSKYRTKNKK